MVAIAKTLETWLRGVLRPVLFVGMSALVAVITLQIVSRVAFTAVSWTEEVARFLLIWLTFVGATLAFAEHRHIAVTILTDRLPDDARKVMKIVGILSCVLFLIVLTRIGWQYMTMQSFQKSASMRLPMIYVYSIIPICSALMAAICVLDLMILLSGDEEGDPE